MYACLRVDYDKLKSLMSNIDWNDALGNLSVLDAWDYSLIPSIVSCKKPFL